MTISANASDFVPEYLCRPKQLADEYLYESRPVFGRGHGCAAAWTFDDTTGKIFSSFIPEYEIASVSPILKGFEKGFFAMSYYMKPKNREGIFTRLKTLCTTYTKWIDELKSMPRANQPDFANQAKDVISRCEMQANRMLKGIEVLEKDTKAFQSFCFMNQCMFLQWAIKDFAKKHGSGVQCSLNEFYNENIEWRPFQIAFILLNITGITNHFDEFRKYVDLLYFPTGGGKTEAYLGLMAFLIGYRRLTASEEKEYEKDGGVTIILRYTLRLLTTQQRDRLTKMVVAAEIIREKEPQKYGTEPISVGFWVGGGVTPNHFYEFNDTKDDPNKGYKEISRLHRQLLVCPYCGKPLDVHDFVLDKDREDVQIFCSDKNCYFARYPDNKKGTSIPVYLVDDQIYRKCPTVIIATVDKFAFLPWSQKVNSLFGRVDRKCPQHGYIAIGENHPSRHAGIKPPVQAIKSFFPPEMIVQDELHLITGPLGTIYGGYEAAIEELCTITKNGKQIPPKYIVSTATIKNADEQILCLYGRRNVAQFPPNGFDIKDSYFTTEVPVEEKPFRKYVGICASGKSVKTATLRAYSVLIQQAVVLGNDPKYKDVIDPYYTLVGYFNSIRELGGTVRLLQDDIPKRIKWIKKHYGHSSFRIIRKYREITSRMSSSKIAELLNELEKTNSEKDCLDVAIATNMIAVGMDIDRLGLMTVLGQPKQSSEYIQASSRIGRSFPGLVVTLYNPYRPRDLSHYENFRGYHSQIYRFVEGTTATPFSARARDRVMHALFVALARLTIDQLAENDAAPNINSVTTAEIDAIINKIASRVIKVAPKRQSDVVAELKQFIDEWKNLGRISPLPLVYYIKDTSKKDRLLNYYGELCSRKEKPTLNSMREVENAASLGYYTGDWNNG
jgi:hypothetical protein